LPDSTFGKHHHAAPDAHFDCCPHLASRIASARVSDDAENRFNAAQRGPARCYAEARSNP